MSGGRKNVFEMMEQAGIEDESVEDKELTYDGKMLKQLMEGKNPKERAETILEYMAHDSEVFPLVFYRIAWELTGFVDLERAANGEPDGLNGGDVNAFIGKRFRDMGTDVVVRTWPEEYNDWLDSLLAMREEGLKAHAVKDTKGEPETSS